MSEIKTITLRQPHSDSDETDEDQGVWDEEALKGKDLSSAVQKNVENSSSQPAQGNAHKLSAPQEILFVAVVCLAQLFTQAGLGSTLAILPVIGDTFGVTNPGTLAWLIAGYSLTVGTFILISGRLGDLYGHKKLLLIGYAWFGVWSVVAGFAVYSNEILFIITRVLSGIGPSLMLPNALAIFGIFYQPGPRKDLVFSLFGAVAPGGCILGAAFAGLFALAWWPWFFWAMGAVLLGIVILGCYVIPDDLPNLEQKHSSIRGFMEAADVLGGTVGVTAMILINFAWNQASVTGWSQPYVYFILIIGVLLVPVFFLIEFRIAKSPLIPIDVLNGTVGAVLCCIACGWGSFGIWIYYVFQFLENIRGASPLLATAWLSPVAITGALASLITAYMLGRAQPATIMVIAMTAFTTGSILIATAPADQIYWGQSFVMSLVITFGMDMSFPAASLIISNAVPSGKQGVGMSLVNTVVNYSISIALGISGTIEMQTKQGEGVLGERLKGYRSAWYFGIGLAGFGLSFSVVNLLATKLRSAKRREEKV